MRSTIRSKFPPTLLLVVAAAATLSPPAPAAAAPCLTHSEARAKWPEAHLWWHTEARCWDRSPKGANDYEARPAIKLIIPQALPDNVAAQPVDQATAVVHTTVYYPTMEVNAWPQHPLPLDAHDMSSWPVLFDVDAPTKFDAWHSRVQGAWSK